MKLTIELVPQTAFYNNIRSELPKQDWDFLRRAFYKKAEYKCEICGGVGEQHPVECHEIWEYNDKKHIQKLVGLIALCPLCHQCKHWGLSQIRGLEEECIKHLCKINRITKAKAYDLVEQAFGVWRGRSEHDWKSDIKYIDKVLQKR